MRLTLAVDDINTRNAEPAISTTLPIMITNR